MAADSYSRVTGNLGVAISTSGPGATNLLTGVACAYYDSVPVLYITGQVATFRDRGDSGVRQVGFQETDTVNIFRPVTKYAVKVVDPKRIRYELEKACYIARDGRPGPVVIDLPDNVQREQVEPESLAAFPRPQRIANHDLLREKVDHVIKLMSNSHRPVLIIGWGIHLARAEEKLLCLIEALDVPVAPTWGVADILPAAHPLNVGTFGTHGTRHANFAVQNADFILSLGSRLDTKATGSPPYWFARNAVKAVVDIDECELNKFDRYGLGIDVPIHANVREFVDAALSRLNSINKPDITRWKKKIANWKAAYPICRADYFVEKFTNPYVFVQILSSELKEGDVIVVDTGCAIAWMMQGFEFKPNQRLFHDWNYTAMGWSLPASVAASLASPKRSIVCITGDGSLMMNIQELATVIRYKLPIKVFLINNSGYSMIKQTQDQWLNSNYIASSVEGGLAFPDFVKVAESFGFHTITIQKNGQIQRRIREALSHSGPVFCNVVIDQDHRVVPQVKFGRPNEDAEPLLPREEFRANMLIDPVEESKSM
jgi:acetolactate synthase-1/2/3 large subunit